MILRADRRRGNQRARHAGVLTALGRTEGSQLLEFALVLPLLLVLLVGIFDFATAFNIKQIMNNATREGARIGSSQEMSDLTTTEPESVKVIHDAVVSYLDNAGMDTIFISNTMTAADNFTWTYYSTDAYGLKIERNVLLEVTTGGTTVTLQATRITLRKPYDWSFGFNKTIKLLVPGASDSDKIPISTYTLMTNK